MANVAVQQDMLEWVEQDRTEVACFTVIRTVDLDRILRIIVPSPEFGPDTLASTLGWLSESDDEAACMAAVGQSGDWVWIYEDNGLTAHDPALIHSLSHDTEMISVFWNADGPVRFTYAVKGEIVRAFDPSTQGGGQGSAEAVGEPLEEEAGLSWKQPLSAALTVQSRLAGQAPLSFEALVSALTLAAGYKA